MVESVTIFSKEVRVMIPISLVVVMVMIRLKKFPAYQRLDLKMILSLMIFIQSMVTKEI